MMTPFTTSNRADLAGRPATLESFREDNIVYSCTSHVDVTARTLLQTIAKRYHLPPIYLVGLMASATKSPQIANILDIYTLCVAATECGSIVFTTWLR